METKIFYQFTEFSTDVFHLYRYLQNKMLYKHVLSIFEKAAFSNQVSSQTKLVHTKF